MTEPASDELIAELENVVGGIPNWTMAALIARIRQAEAERDEALARLEIGPHGEDAIDVAESAMDHLRFQLEIGRAHV